MAHLVMPDVDTEAEMATTVILVTVLLQLHGNCNGTSHGRSNNGYTQLRSCFVHGALTNHRYLTLMAVTLFETIL